VATAASTAAGRRRSRAAPRKPRASVRRTSFITVWRRRLTLLALVAAGLAVTYFAWFRDSSFVAVEQVRVEGVTSVEKDRIVQSLIKAARGMTTLHVQVDRLVAAAREFPTVASVSAETQLPHGMTIHVTERRPALIASADGREVPVAADGTMLPGVDVGHAELPTVSLDSLPNAARLDGDALQEALIVGAAPGPIRPLIEGATLSSDYGVVVSLKGGIEVRFGSGAGGRPKWSAATAVLADPALTTASYVDVSVPERPAVGGTDDPTPASPPAATDPATTTTPVP
jgi:cell division protein FtsQ